MSEPEASEEELEPGQETSSDSNDDDTPIADLKKRRISNIIKHLPECKIVLWKVETPEDLPEAKNVEEHLDMPLDLTLPRRRESDQDDDEAISIEPIVITFYIFLIVF